MSSTTPVSPPVASPSSTPTPAPTVTVTRTAAPVPTPASGVPSGFKNCGGGIYANGNASCGFAINVADAWSFQQSSPIYDVPSPTTGKFYTVHCQGWSPTWCSAGNNAQIWIR